MKILLALLVSAVLYLPFPGPAFAGDLTVSDVKELAGTWEGHVRSTYGPSRRPITLTVREDGSYTAVGDSIAEGKIQLVGGRLIYDSTFSSGTMTVEERGGKQMLLGSGTMKRGGATVTSEYVKLK